MQLKTVQCLGVLYKLSNQRDYGGTESVYAVGRCYFGDYK